MNTIDCECGHILKVRYEDSTILFQNGKEYYSWRCKMCGQEYREESKQVIIIK